MPMTSARLLTRCRDDLLSRASRRAATRVMYGLLLVALGMAVRNTAGAQAAPPVSATNLLTTTVGSVFSWLPSPLALTSHTGKLCSPGACYSGTVDVQANRGWKLQVKLSTTPSSFTVAFVQTTVPPNVQPVNSGTQTWLNTTTWVTIAQSDFPASKAVIGVMFNAKRVSGRGGAVPPPAQVDAVLQYQVVNHP